MHRIPCPWCGLRDEAEFQYAGDAGVARPEAGGSLEAFHDYVYTRTNPRGWHLEWWHHTGGCRQLVKVVRHTVSHEIAATGFAHDHIEVPRE